MSISDIKRATAEQLKFALIENAGAYLKPDEMLMLSAAIEFSHNKLEGLKRASGDPFVVHPLGMALSLSELKLDLSSLQGALLLAPFEEEKTTLEEIASLPEVRSKTAEIVAGAARISKYSYRHGGSNQPESFRRLVLTLAKDIRVLLIKLADRLDSMRTLQYLEPDVRLQIAKETIEIYAPLANRLGVYSIKSELEDLAFRFLEPERYNELKSLVALKRSAREEYISNVKEELSKLLADAGIKGQISGRPKHFWSIQKKLERRKLDFDELYDITAFRVIVEEKHECYQVLGMVHSAYRPIPGQFDDYIAAPKPNGYQSLHTAVIGPNAERIEIQIRTREMHEIAEHGVAAHWIYKEGKVKADGVKSYGSLHEAIAAGKDLSDPALLDALHTDMFDDEVFVFTPKGDVRELPKGAVALDFAYAIHSSVGDRCVGVKIGGRISTIDAALKNGDTVEIITHPKGKPSKDWLNIVKTERAKAKIKHFLTEERREADKELGRELLEKALKEKDTSLSKALKDQTAVAQMLEKTNKRTIDDLYLCLGRGTLTASSLVKMLLPEREVFVAVEERIEDLVNAQDVEPAQMPASAGKLKGDVIIEGVGGMLVNYARCCSPIVGDEIIGYITRGRGVTVHRRDCDRVPRNEPDRLVSAKWAGQGGAMRVRLRVTTADKPGMLSAIGEVFRKMSVNIVAADLQTVDAAATMIFTAHVNGVAELEKLVAALRRVRGVIKVARAGL